MAPPTVQTLQRLAAETGYRPDTLAFLFELSENERSFLDRVLDRGGVNANLLGIEREVGARIAAMPMLAWKGRYVRRRHPPVTSPGPVIRPRRYSSSEDSPDSGGISGSISASNSGIRSRAVVHTMSRSTASYP